MSVLNKATFANKGTYFSVIAVPVILSAVLVFVSFYNFLLFHLLAEFFAIAIAILTCVVAWNMYPFTRNNYLMFLGVGYFWVALLDLLHALSYEGMNIIAISGANTAVQFWLGTRYLEAILLLVAPWFLSHALKRTQTFIFLGFIAGSITLLVYSGFFPEGFIPGKGLTTFKIYSEYAIIFLLAIAIFHLYRRREYLEQKILYTLVAAIILTMCAELAFTFYVDVYDIPNLVGHIFKIFSFWLIFHAIIVTTLREPFLVMSRGATTYDAIPDATIVVDENGIIRKANKAASLLSGVSVGELIGKNNHDVFHSHDILIENCPVCQAIINNEELSALELEVNNNHRWFDFSLSHITGVTDLHGTVEVIRDISLRKLSEQKVKELSFLNNSIIENLPSALFVKNADDHRYIEWNKTAEELTGILKEEVLGNTDYDFLPKEQAQFFIDKDDEVIQSQKPLEIAEEPLTTKLKGTRIFHTKKIPIYNDKGITKYLLGISEDITDILKTKEMLSRSQKMEVVGQMSGGIAHDFNNQLGVILGYTELLQSQDLSEAQYKWLAAVEHAADRCAELTRQLLVFSRNSEIEKECVDINKLIGDMKEMIARSLTPAVNVQYYLSGNLWSTDTNKGSCQDAILNLVINARDVMPNGGTLTIETTNIVVEENNNTLINLLPGNYVQIMISDTGRGMSREESEHIFEPFYTTKDVGKGTGLGLSMVYSFVRHSGGDISLETEPGKGSVFRIYLPRSREKVSDVDTTNKAEETFDRGSESILIVDDEPTLLSFAEYTLKSLGYKVYCAENVDVALAILNRSHIDLLFSDVVMPGKVNGYALAEKALNINSEIKVLLTSGYVDKNGSNKEYDKYNLPLLEKPYSRLSLSKKIRALLDSESLPL